MRGTSAAGVHLPTCSCLLPQSLGETDITQCVGKRAERGDSWTGFYIWFSIWPVCSKTREDEPVSGGGGESHSPLYLQHILKHVPPPQVSLCNLTKKSFMKSLQVFKRYGSENWWMMLIMEGAPSSYQHGTNYLSLAKISHNVKST